jgi:sec-independent protein translocase protein TatA
MPGLGAGHWGYIAVILVIVLIIWGPGKLPDIGSGMGRAIREFRKATSETRDEFNKATRPDEAPASSATPGVNTTGEVTQPPGPPPQPAPVGGGAPGTAPAERDTAEGGHTTAG